MSPAVLVVLADDDASVRRALPRLLRSAGFEVAAFASAAELFAAGIADEAHCLVLDVHLGEISGFELLERLRAAGTGTAAVFITAHDDAATRERAESAGATAYLRKPFEAAIFLDAVREAVGAGSA